MRSNLLGIFVLGAAATVALGGQERPNVLWISADDHAAYVTGCYGNPIVRTPNIDRLAAAPGAMRFDRAYCNSPICTASRQSFLTGRYPRTVGVTLLSTPLPESELTLADLLKEAGYETASFGKMHFNSALKHGFDQRLDQGQWHAALRQRPSGPTPIPQGVELLPPWKPFRDPARIWLNSMAAPYTMAADMPSTFFADAAEKFLAAPRKTLGKPFFLMVSFTEPHSPFHFPVEYRGKYDPAKMPVGQIGPEDEEQVPEIFRELTEGEKRGIVAAYYTSTEWMDHNVGRIMAALEASGEADNTLIIYTGDHGYSLGHHGRFEKHCMYEPAVRSPLIVRRPRSTSSGQVGHGSPGGSTAALTEFVDIVPTVLESCGVPVPRTVQGRSLVPLLTGRTEKHREHIFSTYAHNEEAMVRDERFKLIFIRGKRERDDGYASGRPLPGHTIKLFGLETDPDEFTNLASRPEQADRVQRMLALLAEHMKATDRNPEKLPRTDDPIQILDHCVQPNEATAR